MGTFPDQANDETRPRMTTRAVINFTPNADESSGGAEGEHPGPVLSRHGFEEDAGRERAS